MLISTNAVYGSSLENGEGVVGTVRDLFFNDQSWAVRYLVVETGNWLSGRRVLLPPSMVEQKDWPDRRLWVALTQQQIKDSPDVDTDKPVSRQEQLELEQCCVWGAPMGGFALPVPAQPGAEGDADAESDSHLRSAKQVTGYRIQASDGEIGHVEELILDDEGYLHGLWEFRYLVVDTANWLPAKKVLISPAWTKSISWDEKKVRLAASREMVKDSPEFDPKAPVNRRYEEALCDYYGQPKYWLAHGATTVEAEAGK